MNLKRLFGLALAALVALQPALSTAMTVQPIVIDLETAGRGMSQVITVENTFETPLPVELTVQRIELTGDGVKLTGVDDGDLLIFPPSALIAPGETQSFRVQYVGDPALAESHHYYVTVAQLPVKLPEGQSAIQILYNFQVLISVGPNGMKPDLAVTKAEIVTDEQGRHQPMLTVQNGSPRYGYLSQGRLKVVAFDPTGKEVFRETLNGPEIQQRMGFGLIGGSQNRQLRIPTDLPSADGRVEVTFTPGD